MLFAGSNAKLATISSSAPRRHSHSARVPLGLAYEASQAERKPYVQERRAFLSVDLITG